MAEISRFPTHYAIGAMAVAAAVAAAIWSAGFLVRSSAPWLASTAVDLTVASIALAGLLTLLLMIESVAHERLFTDAFDPLAQRESERLKINQRVLQNTLEQFPLFAAGIAMICWLFPFEPASRATLAATTVWILSRWSFWIGYHIGPQHRIAGLIGTMQSMIILLGTFAVLGWRLAGLAGAALIPGIFAIGEFVIIAGLRRRR